MSPKKLQIKMHLAHIYGQSNVTNKTKTNPLLKTQTKIKQINYFPLRKKMQINYTL